MLNLISRYFGVPLDDGYVCALLSYERNRIDAYYNEDRAARGGVHLTMRVFEHDEDCDPTPPRRCENFVFYYTYTGELTLRYMEGTGRRKRLGERVVPIVINYSEDDDTHYVSPSCATFPFPCRDPIKDRVDLVDVVIQLDKIESLSTTVNGKVADTLIDGLITNAEKFGEYIRKKDLRKNEKCYETESGKHPTLWGCIDGLCSGYEGPPYNFGEIVETCETEQDCPQGYLLSALDCACEDIPCPPCPDGWYQAAAWPDCQCVPPDECPDGSLKVDGVCPPPPPPLGEAEACYDCVVETVAQGKQYVMKLDPCRIVSDGSPISQAVRQYTTSFCGQYRVRIGYREDGFPAFQVRPGPCTDAESLAYRERIAYVEVYNGQDWESVSSFPYDVGPMYADPLGGADRYISWKLTCVNRNDPFAPPIVDERRPQKPFQPTPAEPDPTTQCRYKVDFTVTMAVVAVRRNQAPGVPNSWYEGINFASLPNVGIDLGPFDVTEFVAPCWLDQQFVRTAFDAAVTAANEFVDTAFDSLLTAAFGPPGVLLGRLVDVAITPNIQRMGPE